MANAGHGMNKWPDLTDIGREPGSADDVVLPQAIAAIKSAAIHYQAEAGKARERDIFKGSVPAAITLLVNDVGELAVGDASVNIPAWQKAVKLCCHWNRAQKKAHKCHHRGSSFRHAISLPGDRAG